MANCGMVVIIKKISKNGVESKQRRLVIRGRRIGPTIELRKYSGPFSHPGLTIARL